MEAEQVLVHCLVRLTTTSECNKSLIPSNLAMNRTNNYELITRISY